MTSLRVADAAAAADQQRGQALVDRPVPPLDQAVAVEQQQVARLQLHGGRLRTALARAEQDAVGLRQRPGARAADQHRRRMAGLGPGQHPAGRVEVAGHHRRGVLGRDVPDQVVQPADQLLRRRAGDGQPGQRAAQPGHPGRRGQPVPGHVADRDQHLAGRHARR